MNTKNLFFIAIALFGLSMSGIAQKVEPTADEFGLMKGFPPAEDKMVDAYNWTMYPFNRWAFMNVQRIHSTAFIDNGAQTPYEFEKEIVNLDKLTIPVEGDKDYQLKEILDTHNTDAFVVIHKGKLVYERYWNNMTPYQPHWMASTSKSVIGTVAAILVERGVLDENKTVKEIIPELAESGFADATVRQVLDMTAGTAWDESMSELLDPTSKARQYGAAANSWKIKGYEGSGVFDFLPSIEQDRKHGDVFIYNSPQADLMGWILGRVTGKTVEQNVSDELWRHLGPEGDSYYLIDGAGFAWPTGGLSSNAYDLAKFGVLMQQNGIFNGKRIFPESITKDILENGDTGAFAKGSHAWAYPEGAYRNYWWVTNNEDQAYMAKGMFGQYIYINPTQEVVIIRFASEKVSVDKERTKQVESAFDEISRYLNSSK